MEQDIMNKHGSVILISAHKTFLSVFTKSGRHVCQSLQATEICNAKEYFLLLAYWCNYVDLPDLCKYSKFHEKSVLISAVSFSVSSKLMYYYLIFNKKSLKASNIVSISLITEAY